MIAVAAAAALSLVAGGISAVPGQVEADPAAVIQEAMAVVGQDVASEQLEVTESRAATAVSETDEGAVSITTEASVDSAVVHHDDGVQVMAILEEGSTSTTYDLTMPEGVELVPSGEGYDLVAGGDGFNVVLGRIEEPWAVDAEGRQIPTSYEIEGNELTQHIHGDATYPVVVDPKMTLGAGIYMNGWGWEWGVLRGLIVAAGGSVAVGACVIINIPNPWAAVLKAACGTIGASNLNNFTRWVRNAVAGAGMKMNTCYQTRVLPSRPGFTAVNARNCR